MEGYVGGGSYPQNKWQSKFIATVKAMGGIFDDFPRQITRRIIGGMFIDDTHLRV
jgi:hypothetical protein